MSERQIHDPQSTPEAPAGAAAAADQLASARRRRFIKMGAGAVPVGLTLASRPVLATNCMSASAWGSTLGATTTSQYARARQTGISGVWTLTDWKRSSPACSGWSNTALGCDTATKRSTYQVGTLCGTSIPAGLLTTTPVWNVLNGTSTTVSAKFQRAMLVAWLNYKISSSVRTCVTDPTRPSWNQLTALGQITTSGGKGPDGKWWTQQTVIDYLFNNYVSR